MTRVIMHGCNGHMGQVITKLAEEDTDVEIVAGVDPFDDGHNSYPVFSSIEKCDVDADVVIDFSSAKAEDALIDYCTASKLPVIVCTTGLSEAQLTKIREASEKVAVLKSANMSLGINTLFKLLQDAARVFCDAGFDVELVEKHHNKKLDAPSGTAIKTAELISEKREKIQQGAADEEELMPGARGADFEGMRIHSVRLPGLVAHQEVIFGSQGEGLTLRHDSYDRVSFMTGVNLGIKEVVKRHELVYGLEHLL